jgi:hypothetical protein
MNYANIIWDVRSRLNGHVKKTNLWLYPELGGVSCVGDCDDLTEGDAHLRFYFHYLRTYCAEWWQSRRGTNRLVGRGTW